MTIDLPILFYISIPWFVNVPTSFCLSEYVTTTLTFYHTGETFCQTVKEFLDLYVDGVLDD